VLALIETASGIGAHAFLQSVLVNQRLQTGAHRGATLGGATATRMIRRTLVLADEEMPLEEWHEVLRQAA